MILWGFVCYLQELWMSTDRRRRPNTVFMLHQRSLLSPLVCGLPLPLFSISLWASLSLPVATHHPIWEPRQHKHLSPYRYRVPFGAETIISQLSRKCAQPLWLGQEAASPERLVLIFWRLGARIWKNKRIGAFCLQVIGWLGGPGGVCGLGESVTSWNMTSSRYTNGYWESRRPIFPKLYTRRRLSPLHFIRKEKKKRRLPEARQWKLDRPYKTMFYRFRCNRICQQDFPSLSWIWNSVVLKARANFTLRWRLAGDLWVTKCGTG